MKKLIIIAMCFTLFFVIGCESTPEETVETTETTEVPEVTPTETVDNTLAEENETLMANIKAAREKAVAAGAEKYFGSELMVVDVASTEAHSVYEDGGDEEAFNKSATDILYQYMALEQGSMAAEAQRKIEDMGLSVYDKAGFEAGLESANAALALFNSGADGKALYEEAKKAADAYNAVLFEAFTTLAEEERAAFLEVKGQADEIKAGVAEKDNYNNAVVFFTQGDQNMITDNPETAYNNFSIAKTGMEEVFETVKEKRRLAQEAMDRARRRIEDADEVAEAADTQVPLADVEALSPINEEITEGAE